MASGHLLIHNLRLVAIPMRELTLAMWFPIENMVCLRSLLVLAHWRPAAIGRAKALGLPKQITLSAEKI